MNHTIVHLTGAVFCLTDRKKLPVMDSLKYFFSRIVTGSIKGERCEEGEAEKNGYPPEDGLLPRCVAYLS